MCRQAFVGGVGERLLCSLCPAWLFLPVSQPAVWGSCLESATELGRTWDAAQPAEGSYDA